MSDKVYRIAVVVLLILILVVMGINTYSQLRAQSQNAALIKERIEAVEAQSERMQQEGFVQDRTRPAPQQDFAPQANRDVQPQAQNQELRENLHELTIQNEEQEKQIRELFGQIEELRYQVSVLSELVDNLNAVEESE